MPEAAVVPSVGAVLARATELLEGAGCDSPRLDAELLVAEALGVGRERLVLDANDELEADALAQVELLVARRAAREPVAYILGRKPFRNLVLEVDKRVLIPRPETELLVEVGLSLDRGARVLDLGTGSGAVALALKDERPDLSVTGADLSEGALAVARENARALGLDVLFVQADLLDGLPAGFDAVLANLPYVEQDAALPPEIARYEPAEALLAGVDGLDLIRRLVAMLGEIPLVALEVGAGQAPVVAALLQETGFRFVELVADLAGHERVVLARL